MPEVRFIRRTPGLLLSPFPCLLPGTLLGLLLLLFSGTSIHAQGRFGEWVHTSWTERQGAPSSILGLAKSPDGYLWIGSTEGLFRFDGASFERVRVLGNHGAAVSSIVYELFPVKNGNIWLATADGVAVIDHGQAHLLDIDAAAFPMHVRRFAEDLEGQVYVAAGNGLFRWSPARWERLGKDQGLPSKPFNSVFVTRDGTVLAASESDLYALKPGASTFQKIDTRITVVSQMRQDSTGRIWLADTGASVHPMIVNGPSDPMHGALMHGDPMHGDPMRDSSVQVGAGRILFDSDQALWIATLGDGLRRIENPQTPFGRIDEFSHRASIFTASDGLTDNLVTSLLQDEDGAVWAGSRHGLDCFRKSPVTTTAFSKKFRDVGMRAGPAGDLWLTQGMAFTHASFADHAISTTRSVYPGNHLETHLDIHLATTDPASFPPGTPLCSDVITGVLCFDGKNAEQIPHPRALLPTDIMDRLCVDHNQTLWVATSEYGVFYRPIGPRSNVPRSNEPGGTGVNWVSAPVDGDKITAPVSLAYTGHTGTVWFAFSSRLMTAQAGVVRDVPFANQVHLGTIQAIEDRGDHAWIGATRGLAYLNAGHVTEIASEDAEALTDITGIQETTSGNLLVSTGHGLVHLNAEDLRHAIADSTHKVAYQTLSVREGLPDPDIHYELLTSPGSLWLISQENLSHVDISRIDTYRNAPITSVREVEANGASVPLATTVKLPPRTTNVRFSFVGINLVDPEHVTYRYKLTNIDKDWQNNGSAHQAMYTNLSPGHYEFHVLARNAAGIWSPDNISLQIDILPAWYQRTLVRACAAAALLLIGWAFFRNRIKQAELAVARSFDARLAERMRISADLHDTFLQTVQGSKMIADDALDLPPDPDRMRNTLEKLSLWLGQAVTEGRTALSTLRVSSTERNHLAGFLDRTAKQHSQRTSISVALTVIGDARDLHPIVRDETARIAEEAIRNACLHSRASQLSIELRYARDLSLSLKDNGVGIDPEIIDTGKLGHFGIQGMKERSARIRARITITSTRNTGTEITLRIPGDIAYRREKKPIFARLKTLKLRPNPTPDELHTPGQPATADDE